MKAKVADANAAVSMIDAVHDAVVAGLTPQQVEAIARLAWFAASEASWRFVDADEFAGRCREVARVVDGDEQRKRAAMRATRGPTWKSSSGNGSDATNGAKRKRRGAKR